MSTIKIPMTGLPEIKQAERQLLARASQKPSWSPKELRQQAREALEPQVVSLAFWRLLNDGELELDSNLQVRRRSSER